MDYARVGRMIRSARKRRGMTQEILAERTELSTSFLGHIERGTRKASVETIVRIAKALELSLDALLLPVHLRSESDGDSGAAASEQMEAARELLELALTLSKEYR